VELCRLKERSVNRIVAEDPQLSRLTSAIAQRIGAQRYAVWFSKSTKFDLRNDSLEINVPNDFISEWIGTHFAGPIKEATHEVFGSALPVKFNVVPQLFDKNGDSQAAAAANASATAAVAALSTPSKPAKTVVAKPNGMTQQLGIKVGLDLPTAGAARHIPSAFDRPTTRPSPGAMLGSAQAKPLAPLPSGPIYYDPSSAGVAKNRLRHCLVNYVIGASNQLAYSTANYVCEFPGGQYNPLFIHGSCGLGKTHLLQGLCKRFSEMHPTKKWMYLTGEEFTNEYVTSLRSGKIDHFRRKMRELDLLVIDDVHFLSGKRSTQEEFLHTFNAIEATGKQVVMASDAHPKQIQEFGESLINRFISGMCVRIDPPNYAMRCDILNLMAGKQGITVSPEVVDWIARRVTQNIRELEGALTRVRALARLDGKAPSIEIVKQALGDLDRQMVAPLRPDNILSSVCSYFGLDNRELMSGRRQRTISLARSVAMFLVRKNSRLSFPEIAQKLGKRNHSTVISACRRIEKAFSRNETLSWESSIGDRADEAQELIQRLEEQARSMAV
jgi:chromosomal replication initiator protein